MKRTDKLSNFIAILLFTAFVIYAAAYAIHSIGNTTVTAEAVAAEVRPGGLASGIVIRDETVLTSSEPYVDITARNGTKVAAGTVLATAIHSEEGLERTKRIHELELEISRMSAALEEMNSADDLTSRDEALRSAVDGLTAAIARHELSGLDSSSLNLRSLLFDRSASGASESALKQLQRELDSLKDDPDEDARLLTAESGGIFSTLIDGYESLSPDVLDNLSPAKLEQLLAYHPEPAAGAYGKLVDNFRWYFAAVMSTEDAENLRVGQTATLNFGRWYGSDIYARVLSISEAEDGNVAIVFTCDTALASTLAMRCVSASVVFEAHTGIRVPTDALQTDPETGENYVWVITAMVLERKNVSILYQDEDFAVVERGSAADALREGNTVVVSGQDLYEGKVME